MSRDIVSAFSAAPATDDAMREVATQLEGTKPVLIVFFASIAHDGPKVCEALKRIAPSAEIAGCSTAGEFTDRSYTSGGISVMAFSAAKVKRVVTALATYENGVEAGIRDATRKLAAGFGADLRELDPGRHVGFIFNEALHFRQDDIDEALGHAAPLLSFVGGSAGDDWQIKTTRVYLNGAVSEDGSVLTLMELNVPYAILKTASFEPTSVKLRMDKVSGRAVSQINGGPAREVYAQAIGAPVESLDHAVFWGNPLGVMVDGQPWVRAVVGVLPDGALHLGARIIEGSELYLLKYTDLVGDTQRVLSQTAASLGQPASGAVLFNCGHRCMAIKNMHLESQFSDALQSQGFPIVGFHCYGEDWIVHLNQTLVGVVFG